MDVIFAHGGYDGSPPTLEICWGRYWHSISSGLEGYMQRNLSYYALTSVCLRRNFVDIK